MLVELTGAAKTYAGGGVFGKPGAPALHPIDMAFDAERTPIVAVVGESGSGKTTLGNILLGLIPPSSGEIRYAGRNLWASDGATRRQFRRDVQAIAQDPFAAYNPFYTVDHALRVPIRKFGLARSRAEADALSAAACERVGLNPHDTLGRYPHQLSGGQRQRLMVARALLLRPKLLVADEPVSMVDASLRATILGNIVELNQAHGIGIVYITHDITTAYHVADEVVVLFRGHVVERGDAATVIGSPRHPYTRLLIASIPWPELPRRWSEDDVPEALGTGSSSTGCPFAARCPEALPLCRAETPAFRQLGPNQSAACHRLA